MRHLSQNGSFLDKFFKYLSSLVYNPHYTLENALYFFVEYPNVYEQLQRDI